MISLFKKLMPREDKFFDLFEQHARVVQGAADAMRDIFGGVGDIEANCQKIVDLENQADDITREVLLAVRRSPAVAPFLVASHLSAEPGHAPLLGALGLRPLLSLDMRLGEGSGAVLAMGLVRAACRVMREVRTFEEANIERPER